MQINIVQPIGAGSTYEQSVGAKEFQRDSEHRFRIRWEGGTFPTHASGCAGADGCAPAARGTCLCNITVATGAVLPFTRVGKVFDAKLKIRKQPSFTRQGPHP